MSWVPVSPAAALKPLLAAGLLAFAVLAPIAALSPPRPVAADAPLDVFSARRAERHLAALAATPRAPGTRQHAQAQEYLERTLRELGLEVLVQEVDVTTGVAGFLFSGRGFNVTGRVAGTGGTARAVLLAAHYDTVQRSSGAADDGAGVAVLLEVARALHNGRPSRNDVILVFTDLEEMALLGARGFVASHPWREEIAAVLNFEARGTGGTSTMFETTPDSGALLAALGRSPRPSANSFVTEAARLLPNATDLVAFSAIGAPGLGFAFAQHVENYHAPTDSLANLDLASLQDHGDRALALVRVLANADLAQPRSEDGVYFDLFRRVLVRYSNTLARGLGLATLIALAALLSQAIRRRRLDRAGLGTRADPRWPA